ncbi:TCP-1/cpn60 chaperonin family protein [Tanacetum coccineum]
MEYHTSQSLHKPSRQLLSFIELYSGNIVSRNVLILDIPSSLVIVLTLWSLLLGPGAVPTDTTLSNRGREIDMSDLETYISTTNSNSDKAAKLKAQAANKPERIQLNANQGHENNYAGRWCLKPEKFLDSDADVACFSQQVGSRRGTSKTRELLSRHPQKGNSLKTSGTSKMKRPRKIRYRLQYNESVHNVTVVPFVSLLKKCLQRESPVIIPLIFSLHALYYYYAITAFAHALDAIPMALAENSGLSPIERLSVMNASQIKALASDQIHKRTLYSGSAINAKKIKLTAQEYAASKRKGDEAGKAADTKVSTAMS